MESSLSSAYSILKKCTNTFLNHTANSSKTTDHAVTFALEELKQYTTEQKEYKQKLIEDYMTNHHIPRKEKETAYDLYKTDSLYLRNEWKRSRDTAHVIEYLQFPKPEIITKPQDPIYTIYSSS